LAASARGIFWRPDICAALAVLLAWRGSGAKMSGPAAIVSGFSGARPGRSGRSGSSWASCCGSAGMAEISRFCRARAVTLEGLRWKDARKALI
jgi:hypothetical protein